MYDFSRPDKLPLVAYSLLRKRSVLPYSVCGAETINRISLAKGKPLTVVRYGPSYMAKEHMGVFQISRKNGERSLNVKLSKLILMSFPSRTREK